MLKMHNQYLLDGIGEIGVHRVVLALLGLLCLSAAPQIGWTAAVILAVAMLVLLAISVFMRTESAVDLAMVLLAGLAILLLVVEDLFRALLGRPALSWDASYYDSYQVTYSGTESGLRAVTPLEWISWPICVLGMAFGHGWFMLGGLTCAMLTLIWRKAKEPISGTLYGW
jgi:hypothetical protein